jgi:hypothetical protein
MNPALVTIIENYNRPIVDENGIKNPHSPMLSDAIVCFTAWRSLAGELRNIPIYAICPSSYTLTDEQQAKLSELNVTYMEVPELISTSDNFKYPIFNKPLVMAWADNNLTEDLLIHIDLDMTLIKEPSLLLMSPGYNKIAKIASYWWKEQPACDSSFVCAFRKDKFFSKWYETFMNSLSLTPNNPVSTLSESALNKIVGAIPEQIDIINYIQYGKKYDIDTIPEGHIKDIYFINNHNKCINIIAQTRKYISRFKLEI